MQAAFRLFLRVVTFFLMRAAPLLRGRGKDGGCAAVTWAYRPTTDWPWGPPFGQTPSRASHQRSGIFNRLGSLRSASCLPCSTWARARAWMRLCRPSYPGPPSSPSLYPAPPCFALRRGAPTTDLGCNRHADNSSACRWLSPRLIPRSRDPAGPSSLLRMADRPPPGPIRPARARQGGRNRPKSAPKSLFHPILTYLSRDYRHKNSIFDRVVLCIKCDNPAPLVRQSVAFNLSLFSCPPCRFTDNFT